MEGLLNIKASRKEGYRRTFIQFPTMPLLSQAQSNPFFPLTQPFFPIAFILESSWGAASTCAAISEMICPSSCAMESRCDCLLSL